MDTTKISRILKGKVAISEPTVVEGWVRTRRDSKAGLSFLQLSDGSCFDALQIIAEKSLDNYDDAVLHITTGCAIRAKGTIQESKGQGQSIELRAESIEVVGWVEDPETYPIQPKRHTPEFLRDVAHLRPRTNLIGAVSRVRHTLAQAVHRFFDEQGFYWIHTPIITASDTEGAGEMFRVSTLDMANAPKNETGGVDWTKDFFGRETWLTVSGQLNVESYCLALSRVYTFGPTFRAENSNTRRHLAEFLMIEPEIAFADINDNIDLAESFLKSIFVSLLDKRVDDMQFFAKWVDQNCIERIESMVSATFERMEYDEAIRLLEKSSCTFEFEPVWGTDLQSEHERYLTEKVVGRPIAVVNYPKDIKPFYMRLNDDRRTVAAMDVLAPGIGELIGGSQREERLNILDARIEETQLNKQDYWWYRDLRRYGTVPHAGFGLGFERAIQYATGVENIRDVIPFPRASRQAEF